MTTDDRDIEPSNPSKSFKVGEFDRLSGFFTPVWESKRKIRSESPVPSSMTGQGAPVSVKGPASSKTSKPASAPIPTLAKAPANANPSGPPSEAASEEPPSDKPTSGKAEPTQKAVANAAPAVAAATTGAPPSPRAPGINVRPVIPMPLTSPHLVAARAKRATKPPSAASIALEQAGPNLGPEAYLDQEPEFRPALASPAPAPRERGDIHVRSLRASAAATAAHDKLKAKVQLDSADTHARHRETDSDREAVQALEARTVALSTEPYPLHLLRRLRRTIHVSMPLPESVRSLLAKYRRN
jgi:hypothetical protein